MHIEYSDKVDLAAAGTHTWTVSLENTDALAFAIRASAAGASAAPTVTITTFAGTTGVTVTPVTYNGAPNFNANLLGLWQGAAFSRALIIAGGWVARLVGAISDSSSAIHATRAVFPASHIKILVTAVDDTLTNLQLITFVTRHGAR